MDRAKRRGALGVRRPELRAQAAARSCRMVTVDRFCTAPGFTAVERIFGDVSATPARRPSGSPRRQPVYIPGPMTLAPLRSAADRANCAKISATTASCLRRRPEWRRPVSSASSKPILNLQAADTFLNSPALAVTIVARPHGRERRSGRSLPADRLSAASSPERIPPYSASAGTSNAAR